MDTTTVISNPGSIPELTKFAEWSLANDRRIIFASPIAINSATSARLEGSKVSLLSRVGASMRARSVDHLSFRSCSSSERAGYPPLAPNDSYLNGTNALTPPLLREYVDTARSDECSCAQRPGSKRSGLLGARVKAFSTTQSFTTM